MTQQSVGQTPLQEMKYAGDVSDLTEFYRDAGKSRNTERTYDNAINHYRFVWGGQLPASASAVCSYLTAHAQALKVSTLRLRLAALAKWHQAQGFPDPTAETPVRETMRGIAKLHQGKQKQAYPLTFKHLRAMCDSLEAKKRDAIQADDQGEILRTHRDLALILLGFWQGFRSDELSRVCAENVTSHRDQGITIFLPYSKTDAEGRGRNYELPALRAYCPTAAYLNWLQVSGINTGPVFRSISRWGELSKNGFNKRSIEHVLNRVAEGIFPGEPKFTTHSMRHGFADWAVREGWDMKALMEHVGWRSAESARRYMPAIKSFGELALSDRAGAISHDPHLSGAGKTFIASYAEISEND